MVEVTESIWSTACDVVAATVAGAPALAATGAAVLVALTTVAERAVGVLATAGAAALPLTGLAIAAGRGVIATTAVATPSLGTRP